MIAISAEIRSGYTGVDHLITQSVRNAVYFAVEGKQFRTAAAALKAAHRAFWKSVDRRAWAARVVVHVRYADGRYGTIG